MLKRLRKVPSEHKRVDRMLKGDNTGKTSTTPTSCFDLDSSHRSISEFDLSLPFDLDSSVQSLPLILEASTYQNVLTRSTDANGEEEEEEDSSEKSFDIHKHPRSNSERTTSTYSTSMTSTTSLSCSPTLSKRSLKRVSWSSIELYNHSVTLGDNPSVSIGPPICISDNLLSKDTFPLDDFEAVRPQRRGKQEMCLSRLDREDWLREEGFGRADFREVEMAISKIKKARQANSRKSLWEKLRKGSKP